MKNLKFTSLLFFCFSILSCQNDDIKTASQDDESRMLKALLSNQKFILMINNSIQLRHEIKDKKINIEKIRANQEVLSKFKTDEEFKENLSSLTSNHELVFKYFHSIRELGNDLNSRPEYMSLTSDRKRILIQKAIQFKNKEFSDLEKRSRTSLWCQGTCNGQYWSDMDYCAIRLGIGVVAAGAAGAASLGAGAFGFVVVIVDNMVCESQAIADLGYCNDGCAN